MDTRDVNERYTRFGEFIEPTEREGPLLRKDCKCICHIPGRNVMHCVPCCLSTPEEYDLDYFRHRLAVGLKVTPVPEQNLNIQEDPENKA